MDKASVARVCIMFNYKNIYSLKFFKIMSICCAFSFSLLPFPGWGRGAGVLVSPLLPGYTKAVWFPSAEVAASHVHSLAHLRCALAGSGRHTWNPGSTYRTVRGQWTGQGAPNGSSALSRVLMGGQLFL